MKAKNCLKMYAHLKSTNVIINKPDIAPVNPIIDNSNIENAIDETRQVMAELRSFMQNPTHNQCEPTPCTLSDEDINEIESTLLEYQEKYFADCPLSDTLPKMFVWNMPQELMEVHRIAKDYDVDAIDPLIFLYMMLANPAENMLVWVEKYKEILEHDQEYFKYLVDEEETISEDYESED